MDLRFSSFTLDILGFLIACSPFVVAVLRLSLNGQARVLGERYVPIAEYNQRQTRMQSNEEIDAYGLMSCSMRSISAPLRFVLAIALRAALRVTGETFPLWGKILYQMGVNIVRSKPDTHKPISNRSMILEYTDLANVKSDIDAIRTCRRRPLRHEM